MTSELQFVIIGVLANVVGDQILTLALVGAMHIWGRFGRSATRHDELDERTFAPPPDHRPVLSGEEVLLSADVR